MFSKILISLVIILSLSTINFAQSNNQNQNSTKKKFKIDLYDIAMITPMIIDEFPSCSNCIERNPIPFKTRIGTKIGIFGITKLLDYEFPNNKKEMKIFKLLISGLYIGVIVHNFRVK